MSRHWLPYPARVMLLFLPRLEVIYEPSLLPIVTFAYHNVSHMISIPLNLLKAPDLEYGQPWHRLCPIHQKGRAYLIGSPTVITAFDITLNMLPLKIVPSCLQKLIVIHIRQVDPSRLPVHNPEDAILVFFYLPIKCSLLFRGNDPGRLVDVDVRYGIFFELGDFEAYGRSGDNFTNEPAYALLLGGY